MHRGGGGVKLVRPDGETRTPLIRSDQQQSPMGRDKYIPASLNRAFFWLSAFYLVYCARPEDWIPGLKYIPVAKITGLLAFISLLASMGKTKRTFKDLPQEARYLLMLIGVLFLSGFLSPIWKGGAVLHALDFSKVYVAWVLTFLLVTNFERLRRVILIQSASVAVICAVSIAKGHSQPRLEGVIGGIYSNPNDLAFSIVLTLPFCLAFLLTTKSVFGKLFWVFGLLVMATALFMTASRAGFITLVISGTVCLWHFGVKGRRLALIVATGVVGALLLLVAGRPLMERFSAVAEEGGSTQQQGKAYESYEQRKFLMERAVQGIEEHPFLGLGMRNFTVYSMVWHEVHMTYLQIAVEGGIPALILYLLFFYCAFKNLRQLRKRRDLDPQTVLLVGGLHSSMIGFVVGALFAPEAYQFFPYFAVAFTSALVAIIKEKDEARKSSTGPRQPDRKVYATDGSSSSYALVR